MEILIFVGLVVFITHALEAVTGFGCTVLAFPFVLMLFDGDIDHTKVLLSVPALAIAAYYSVTKYRQIDRKQFLIIILFAALGMPIGMWLFESMNADILTLILGSFIVLSASLQLMGNAAAKILDILPRKGYLIAGGIVHGAFAVGGPLITLYSANVISDKGRFRATMCLLWTILNTVLLIMFAATGKLTPTLGNELLFTAPFLIAGIIVGDMIHNRVNEALFRKIVFSSLLLVGIVMILNCNLN
ncbi:MAG: sulfite exporter TauE/SafE family protein [Tannerella sp.]|jgi:uncharacterized membrane protein YfcA|nr:sulfite exporter TauE/SafE family protein [Tannerella sp.]